MEWIEANWWAFDDPIRWRCEWQFRRRFAVELFSGKHSSFNNQKFSLHHVGWRRGFWWLWQQWQGLKQDMSLLFGFNFVVNLLQLSDETSDLKNWNHMFTAGSMVFEYNRIESLSDFKLGGSLSEIWKGNLNCQILIASMKSSLNVSICIQERLSELSVIELEENSNLQKQAMLLTDNETQFQSRIKIKIENIRKSFHERCLNIKKSVKHDHQCYLQHAESFKKPHLSNQKLQQLKKQTSPFWTRNCNQLKNASTRFKRCKIQRYFNIWV